MPKKAPPAIEEDEGPSKAWMESYADAMTLLLAFFIMMFAFALVDETKFFDFKVGMVTALGIPSPVTDHAESILLDGSGIAPTLGDNMIPADDLADDTTVSSATEGTITPENAEEVRNLIEQEFDALGASEYVSVELDERGVVIRFDSRILFASGSAELGVDAPVVLDATAEVIAEVDNGVDVEGHTDDVPLNAFARFPSNWELSGARASTVVRYLLDAAVLAPSRMAAVGMADTRPRQTNATEAGRSENRRVEVVLRVDGYAGPELELIEPIDLFDDDFGRQEPGDSDTEPGDTESDDTDTEAPESPGSDDG